MKINIKELPDKTVSRKMISVGGLEVDAYELVDIMEALEATDGFFTAVVVRDETLRKKLSELDIIKTNIRGGSYCGPNYDTFQRQLYKHLGY